MASGVEGYEGVDEILRQVRGRIRVPVREELVSSRRACGRVASRDVASQRDVPGRDASHMDGFGVNSADLRGASTERPVRLMVVGELGPGSRNPMPIGRGECARVATGAPMPQGADAVVPVEMVKEKGGWITTGFSPGEGRWVYHRGGDVKKGEVVLGKGRRVRVQDVGRLLSLGIPKVWVRAKPRVALLRTGSELVGAGRGGRVQDSHGPVFHGLLMALGCDPVDSGVVEDDRGLITKRARLALGKSDFVIAMGGTSAGKRDFVWAAVSRLRPEVGFRGVRMDRGRVTGFAVVKGKPVLMMPGPIQGAMNAFVVLGMPTIELLSGGELPVQVVTARMTKAWKARERFATFTKVAYVRLREDGAAEPILGETESMSVLTGADGFVVVPENVTAIQAGEDVRVRLVPGFSFA